MPVVGNLKEVASAPRRMCIRMTCVDHRVLQKVAADLAQFLKKENFTVSGPVALPNHKTVFFLRSCHFIYKESGEHWGVRHSTRIIYVDLKENQNMGEKIPDFHIPSIVKISIKPV